MVELFEKRMKGVEEVAEYKIRTGKKVLDPERACQTGRDQGPKKAHGEFNELGEPGAFAGQKIMAMAESSAISFSPSMAQKKRKTSKW